MAWFIDSLQFRKKQWLDKDVKSCEPRSKESEIRILVIGDSLAIIGIGCNELFDVTKDDANSAAQLPTLVENTSAAMSLATSSSVDHGGGPEFPRALARTLSHFFQRPVRWRSAGVDGGDVDDIRSCCMGVVKQESAKENGQPVDVVVVLFGINDLKRLLSSAEGGVNHFRRSVEKLLAEIREVQPGALVVFPEIPFQSNIYPLSLVLETAIGLWERLKRLVANSRSNAMYLELSTADMVSLYYTGRKRTQLLGKDDSVIAADNHGSFELDEKYEGSSDEMLSPDNVHPNKKI